MGSPKTYQLGNQVKHLLIIFSIFLFSLTIISCSRSSDDGSKSTDNTTTTDTTAPVIAEVTAVTTPTNDTTPNYIFSSTEAGTISYGGSCSSNTSIAISGNNIITLNSLSDGTFSDCIITVRGTTGYLSNTLTITSFIVDSTAATLAEVTSVTTPTNDTIPDYTFSSSEAGTITYGGSCSSSTTSATTGNNTITLVSLTEGTYSNCTITVTENAGNSVTLNISSFIIDTTAPTLAEVTAVTTPTNDTTPDYTFSSSEAGTITFGGPCSSGTTSTSEISGGRITFNALSDGTYSNCTIIVTDSAGNASNTLSISSFIIDISYDACVDSNTMCLTLTWTDGLDPDLHSYYFPDWTYEEEETSGFDNTSRGTRYWVYGNAANKKYSETGDTIQFIDGTSPSDIETQVWATDSQKVGNGTYLFYVEDVSETDVQNFKLVLSGPGLSDNITYGPYDFKDDYNDSTTEALNPQAVFFIQVDYNSIVRSDNFTVGDNLSSSTLMQWTGPMKNSVVVGQ